MSKRFKRRTGWRKKGIFFLLVQKQGVTIVELIITFMLTVLFTTGTCSLMADSMKIYNKIRALNNSQQVMDIILDKVTGEIEGAQVAMRDKTGGGSGGSGSGAVSDATLRISPDQKKITLYDRTSSEIEIYQAADVNTNKNVVVIHYEKIEKSNLAAVDWKFDSSVYMGFEVEDLKFELAGTEYPKNIIKVSLTLKSDAFGSFTNTRYVECYNFDASTFNKIEQETS